MLRANDFMREIKRKQRENVLLVRERFRIRTIETLKKWGCQDTCPFFQRDIFNLQKSLELCNCPISSVKYAPKGLKKLEDSL
jgi:hypothetical protein